MEIKKFIDNH